LKATTSILKGQQGKWFFFFHLVGFLYPLALEFATPSVNKMCRKFSCKKTCKVVYKSLCTYFLHLWFFTKIFMHNYVHMWKITTTMKIIIIWIMQYFSLKFIPFSFYIWKIVKTKSLSPVVKKWYLDCQYVHMFFFIIKLTI